MEVLLVRVLTRLVQVHSALGDQAFEFATKEALLAIARCIHDDVVERTSTSPATAVVIPFPNRALRARREGNRDQEDAPSV